MKVNIGDNVFVRTPTRDDYIGRLVEQDGPFTVTLDQCSWVADSGRFGAFRRGGVQEQTEVEFVGDGETLHWVSIGPWPHKLPETDQ